MIKADQYYKETIENILLFDGQWDKNPRTIWADGEKAHSKFITQQFYRYNIYNDEFPINTIRQTFLKGAFYDIESIYIKQTNLIEDMHPCIHKWWADAVVSKYTPKELSEKWAYQYETEETYTDKNPLDFQKHSLGAVYGHTVRKYDLMNKLLKGLEENPFGRRHSINLNQEQQKIDDSKALQPCAFETLWSVREYLYNASRADCRIARFIDLTLIQRSQDVIPVFSINAIQYVMLGMMVCNHLTFKTGIQHEVSNFSHFIQNSHIYDRHLDFAKELLLVEPLTVQPTIKLICEPKDFYSHVWEDFKIFGVENIKKQDFKLEIAK